MQPTLQRWVNAPTSSPPPQETTKRRVIALFDRSGLSIEPWAARGFECVAFDVSLEGAHHGSRVSLQQATLSSEADLLECLGPLDTLAFIAALPPCRDICAAGARWWKMKRERDPGFQEKASTYLTLLERVLQSTGVPYCILVPAAPLIRKCFAKRRPLLFSPYEFGGYLPTNHVHPFGAHVPPRDAYTKRTLCFTSHGVRLPWKRAIAPVVKTVTLKSGKTKNISPVMLKRGTSSSRTLAPIGFLSALCGMVVPHAL